MLKSTSTTNNSEASMEISNKDSIESLLPPFSIKTNPIQGEVIEIKPVIMRNFKDLILVCAPIMEDIKGLNLNKPDTSSKEKLYDFLENHTDNIIKAVALMSGKSEQFVEDCNMEEMTDLLIKCITVNIDFFIKRLTPTLSQQTAEVVKVIRLLGTTTSKS